MAAPDHGPVKLLSIDGGGIRGLSALVLLEQLMDNANEQRRLVNLAPQEPWEMFDMIGGTSTGGLIAVMLGRLRMSVEDCKEAYMSLGRRAFTPVNFVKRITGKATVGPQFQTEPLENAIKEIIGDDWETKLLKEDDPQCRVSVSRRQYSHHCDSLWPGSLSPTRSAPIQYHF
ncbi:acyl transferase/acyl hydrolase/lysophospholipase [Nemania sp. FL0916]|nr:acyl transferase/acyl hydrolase/lysophospholipase [Nemania sp. FL0916]